MECGICMEAYDSASRRPKMFPCGHSACLACLQGFKEKRCPECRRGFACAASNLPDNFAVLRMIESSSRRPRLWCSDCKAVASPDCFENHNLKSVKAALQDEVVQLQVRAALLAEDLPAALRVDADGAREQALRVLELARQPGTILEVSVRGQRGEALTATWTNPPAAPAGQQGIADDVQSVATDVLVLALAKKGVWQQRGAKRQREGDGHQEGRDRAEAASNLPVMEELKVDESPHFGRKGNLLQTVRRHRVRRLTNLSCHLDPALALRLLQLVAPHAEQLQVTWARKAHLQAVLAMPRLRRLHLHSDSADPCEFPAALPPPPAHHAGLRFLRVEFLPEETTFSLIRAHAGTLEELWLTVGSPDGGWWPFGCDDLHAALGRCGLARLRRLVLVRVGHVQRRCPAQLSAVRRALPRVQVQCKRCQKSVAFDF